MAMQPCYYNCEDGMKKFIPILTTQAGLCLTYDNWEAIGIDTVSYHLDSLLMKPGFARLSELNNLASYVGWKKNILLNASMLQANQAGDYIVKSDYDGARTQYTHEQIINLIAQLKPTMVLLPGGALQDHIHYAGIDYVESNQPALDGYHGIVYEKSNSFSVQDETQRLQFEVIDCACGCPTCRQGFTRAYLHHLFQHTPLLCQRLLIQHNSYSFKQFQHHAPHPG